MLTYQGETIEFSCKLIGDDGEQITDLSAYKISCMLRERDNQKIIWSTTGTASTLPIVVSNGAFSLFMWTGSNQTFIRDLYTGSEIHKHKHR